MKAFSVVRASLIPLLLFPMHAAAQDMAKAVKRFELNPSKLQSPSALKDAVEAVQRDGEKTITVINGPRPAPTPAPAPPPAPAPAPASLPLSPSGALSGRLGYAGTIDFNNTVGYHDTDNAIPASSGNPTEKSESTVKIAEYVIDPRVINGRPIAIGTAPWQVALIRGDTPKQIRLPFCGGSIVGAQWIVTAAHCLEGNSDPKYIDVVSGTSWPKFSDQGDRVDVAKILIHPQWNATTFENDIALLKLSRPLKLGRKIALVRSGTQLPLNSNLMISGWGAVTMWGQMSEQLMAANVPLVSNDVCNDAKSYNGTIKTGMMCAGFYDGGIDSCQGDSGGPIVAKIGSIQTLVGIVSFGNGCALKLKYGVYTRLSEYTGWARGQMLEATKVSERQ